MSVIFRFAGDAGFYKLGRSIRHVKAWNTDEIFHARKIEEGEGEGEGDREGGDCTVI